MKETKRKHLLLGHDKRPKQELLDIIVYLCRIFVKGCGCVVVGGLLEEGGGGHWGPLSFDTPDNRTFEQGCICM